jgi:hypothetical protein
MVRPAVLSTNFSTIESFVRATSFRDGGLLAKRKAAEEAEDVDANKSNKRMKN